MVYYRPSQERVQTHLRAKVEHISAPERFEQFDHMVRTLNRDGLYDAAASADMTLGASIADECTKHLVPAGLPSS